MEKSHPLRQFLHRHKYLVVTVIFVAIIGFLDENSLVQRFQHKREIAALKEEIAKYTIQYEEDTRKLEELNSNPEAIEKIAREKYLMKTPDEDVFIFEE